MITPEVSDPTVLDRSPVSAPPVVPPSSNGDPRPRRGVFIMPDIIRCEIRNKTQHENCWTIHYVWMMRVHGEFERVEIAHVNSRVYRQWLDSYPMPDGIPPHIQFGGAVVSGAPDPTFKDRWASYARRVFC